MATCLLAAILCVEPAAASGILTSDAPRRVSVTARTLFTEMAISTRAVPFDAGPKTQKSNPGPAKSVGAIL